MQFSQSGAGGVNAGAHRDVERFGNLAEGRALAAEDEALPLAQRQRTESPGELLERLPPFQARVSVAGRAGYRFFPAAPTVFSEEQLSLASMMARDCQILRASTEPMEEVVDAGR